MPAAPPGVGYSILLPLEGDRGDLRAALGAWRAQKSVPAEQVEVVAATARPARRRPPELEAFGVRLVGEPGANLSRLYDLAARAARGDVLVFTESHCVPERDFLAELGRALAATNHAGVCCRVVPVCDNALAEMDALLCEEGCAIFRTPGDWRKFNVQGVALRRDAYLAVGGLRHHYGRFAEMLLAADLRDAGLTMSYADGPTVRHRFRTGLRGLQSDIRSYVGGENLYRHEHPGPYRVGHTYAFPLHPDAHKADLVNHLFATLRGDALRRALLRGDGAALSAARRAARLWMQAGTGAYWRDRLAARLAVLRCHLWRLSRRKLEAAFRDIWPAASRALRLRFLIDHPPATTPQLPDAGSLAITELPERDVLGLSEVESFEGRQFRWTGPVAVLRLSLSDVAHELTLETCGLRREPVPLRLRAYYRGRRVPDDAISHDEGAIRLRLPAGTGAPCLVLTCEPIRPWAAGVADARELGLPLFSVSWGATRAQRLAA